MDDSCCRKAERSHIYTLTGPILASITAQDDTYRLELHEVKCGRHYVVTLIDRTQATIGFVWNLSDDPRPYCPICVDWHSHEGSPFEYFNGAEIIAQYSKMRALMGAKLINQIARDVNGWIVCRVHS